MPESSGKESLNDMALISRDDRCFTELSLFAGIGGGILGSQLLGWRVVCGVEIDPYCREVLLRRQEEGILEPFPIWNDARTFDGKPWHGVVDIITSGFPCQPFSVAGRRRGADDERNMWPDTIRIIGEVRPRYALLENVAGLLTARQKVTLMVLEKVRQLRLFGPGSLQSHTGHIIRRFFKAFSDRYLLRIFGDIAEMGYDAKWGVVGADDVGAPHERERLWILLSDPMQCRCGELLQSESKRRCGGQADFGCNGETQFVADPERARLEGAIAAGDTRAGGLPVERRCTWWDIDPADLPDSAQLQRQAIERGTTDGVLPEIRDSQIDSERSGLCQTEPGGIGRGRSDDSGSGTAFPGLGGMVDELPDWLDLIAAAFGGEIPRVAEAIPYRVDRLKGLGNAQVPLCAAQAWRLLRP